MQDKMNHTDIDTFLGLVLEHLVRLLEATPPRSEASYVVTSCLMHVCNQYIAAVATYPQVLNLIVTRLLDYMHDPLPGVRDMACSSFNKVCQGCASTLANQVIGDHSSSVLWIVQQDISSHTSDLDASQVRL
jgi:exportin-1